MKKKHSEYFESVKDEIVKKGFLTKEISGLYMSLFLYQEKYIEKYNDMSGNVKFLNKDKLPLINSKKIKFSSEERSRLLDALKELTGAIKKDHKGLNFSYLLESLKINSEYCKDLVEYLLTGNFEKLHAMSKEFKIGIEELIFLLINWLKPYLISLRKQYPDTIDTKEWLKPNCPVCGYYPDISKIIESKDNIRIMHCGLCESEWHYPRVMCAICENNDMDSLGYLVHEDEALYRIDYCDGCKGYIKTIRIPGKDEEGRYDLTVENIITNFLDASAIEMGYNRP